MPGSSPLARGTLFRTAKDNNLEGLIPARAGNTKTLPFRVFLSGAHPRSRGEHLPLVDVVVGCVGSSPLARGTQGHLQGKPAEGGLIPARAGNTYPRAQWLESGRAHPRSRGEHTC